MIERFTLALKGMAMGIAEVIPGVSGGTIAFITNIYEELIQTIKSFDWRVVQLLLRGEWHLAWKKINGNFLLNLLSGMVLGLLCGIFLISYLLEAHPEALWGFFFGLVLASSIYIGKQLEKFELKEILILAIGIFVAYYITTITPANGSDSLIAVFFSAMIAVIALILPGISGSFILLLLGMYSLIIPQFKELISNPNSYSLAICLVFAAGAAIGISIFSRFLSFAFQKYKNSTFALLTGFMVGSLNKIWPWRNPVLGVNSETGEKIRMTSWLDDSTEFPELLKIVKEVNVLPGEYFRHAEITAVAVSFLLGFAIIFIIEYFQKRKPGVR